KKSFKYGKMEARMKLPYGNGMWPAFWMMGNTGQWPACGEIDIMEMVGGNKCGWDCGDNKTHGYLWWEENGEKMAGTQSPPLTSGKYADAYHVFSVEWDEQSIKWFVDGNQFYSKNITSPGMSEFHQPFYFLLNLAIGGDWPKSPDNSTVFPQKLYVDYVRVYEKVNCTIPAQPSAITGNSTVIEGSPQTYSIAPVSGATSYTWTLPSGWSGSSTSTSISTVAGSSGGVISVKANNNCGSSAARTLNVTVNCPVPAQPSAITGNINIQSGSPQTYSIAPVSGATSYTWTLPSGWSGSSTSTSISTVAGSSGGIISVKANNSCGSGPARTINVTVTGAPLGNIALNKQVTTSSIEAVGLEGNKAIDGNYSSRWASLEGVDPQWIYVDLGAVYDINRVKIVWETAYGKNYEVQVSTNASSWTSVKNVIGNSALVNDHTGLTATGRYVRILGTERGTQWGYSIYELEVYGTESNNNNGFSLKIEAEDYIAMSGIQTEECSEGGLNVGWFDTYDWMAYSVTIPTTGTYKVSYRVASTTSGNSLRLEKDAGATLLGVVNVPNTGDWQAWATVEHYVTLPAGSYSIGITTYTGGLNLNWIEISNQASVFKLVTPASDNRISFPNPIINTMYLKEQLEETADVQVFDIMGVVVKSETVSAGTTAISMEGLKTGWYNVRIITSKMIKEERVYKQ
ncbi:MAG TPA: carbohydrate-binding protein, partial [Cytophagaceae bacterium]